MRNLTINFFGFLLILLMLKNTNTQPANDNVSDITDLDDATDTDTSSYIDPERTIDNHPLTVSIILLDTDDDINSGGDVDFKDVNDDRADLGLRKTVNNESPNQGDNITFPLTIRNNGSSSPTNI